MFHTWLLTTVLEPAFRAHRFLRGAAVLILPRLWELDRSQPTVLLILATAHDLLDYEAAAGSLATSTQDPNLPTGVSMYDLFGPLAPPFELATREFFRGADGEVLDAFASYGWFRRDGDAVVVDRQDRQMGERLDTYLMRP